jgi:hypothetical protein
MAKEAAKANEDDALLAAIDGVIVEFQRRGWLVAAAKGEDVMNEVLRLLGRTMSTSRVSDIERALYDVGPSTTQ